MLQGVVVGGRHLQALASVTRRGSLVAHVIPSPVACLQPRQSQEKLDPTVTPQPWGTHEPIQQEPNAQDSPRGQFTRESSEPKATFTCTRHRNIQFTSVINSTDHLPLQNVRAMRAGVRLFFSLAVSTVLGKQQLSGEGGQNPNTIDHRM